MMLWFWSERNIFLWTSCAKNTISEQVNHHPSSISQEHWTCFGHFSLVNDVYSLGNNAFTGIAESFLSCNKTQCMQLYL